MISGSTRVFAVLGDPVSHSLSPAMQTAAFRVLGLNAVYVPLRCSGEDLPGLLRAVARAGGGGNVTVPHKAVAFSSVDETTPLARESGAVNTFWSEGARVWGHNSDVAGIVAALERLEAPRTRWLVLGTGGAARAAALAARQLGAALAVRSRDPSRRERYLTWAKSLGVAAGDERECEVVINATPLGLRADDPLPFQPSGDHRIRVALDLVYGARETAWVRAMRGHEARAADGREMLIAQGAEAFRRWFPDQEPPVEVMRAVVYDRLR